MKRDTVTTPGFGDRPTARFRIIDHLDCILTPLEALSDMLYQSGREDISALLDALIRDGHTQIEQASELLESKVGIIEFVMRPGKDPQLLGVHMPDLAVYAADEEVPHAQ